MVEIRGKDKTENQNNRKNVSSVYKHVDIIIKQVYHILFHILDDIFRMLNVYQ